MMNPIAFLTSRFAKAGPVGRGLVTLLPLVVAYAGLLLLAYQPELQYPVPALDVARYESAWIFYMGVCACTPLWLARRHPKGWWKALLPFLLIEGSLFMKLLGSYITFYPASGPASMGAAGLGAVLFGTYAVLSIPATALAASIVRHRLSS